MEPLLKFNVRNQNISRVDKFLPVRYSHNYLYAEFDFKTPEWNEKTKTALFKVNGKEPIPVLLGDTDTCMVPWEVLEYTEFTVSIIGGNLITVDSAPVKLYESGYRSGEIDPTPTIYEQVMQSFEDTKQYTSEQAEISKRYAVGSLSYPGSDTDNAKYYAQKSQENAEKTDRDRREVEGLVLQLDEVRQNIALADQYKEQAAQSAANALQSESNAKLSEEIASQASARAESSEDAAAQWAAEAQQAKSETQTLSEQVTADKQDVQKMKQSVESTKAQVDNVLSVFNQTVQNAIEDVNFAGTKQIENIKKESSKQIDAVTAAGTEQIYAIQAEGDTQTALVREAAEEITADRDQIDLNRRNILKTAIKRSASGRTILIQDSAEMPFAGMRQYGHSRQQTTTGAQLLNPELFEDGITSGGITFVKQADGGIKLEGTQTGVSTLWYGEYIDILQDGITYFFNPDASGGNFQYTAGGQKQYAKKITVDKSTMTSIMPYSQWESGANAGKVIYPMINAGDTALPWEPYTGGRPSPSPEYPQEIVSAGDRGIVSTYVSGRNLFNVNDKNRFGNWENDENGWITAELDNTGGSKRNYVLNNVNVQELIEPDKEYLLVTEIKEISEMLVLSLTNNEDNIKGQFKNSVDYTNTGTFVKKIESRSDFTGCTTMLRTVCGVDPGKKGRAVFRLSVIRDTTVTADTFVYEPYREQILSFSTPNGLPGIPVSSGGNYTDETGQQWIADYRDWERGVDVQMVKILENITFKINPGNNYEVDGSYLFRYSDNDFPNDRTNYIVLCTNLEHNFNILAKNESGCYAGYNCIWVRLKNINDVNAVNEELRDAKFVINIATPIETPIPADELAAYHALHTNYPATAITSDDSWTDAEYIADPENHISQNYVTADAYQSLEQRVAALENNAVGNI